MGVFPAHAVSRTPQIDLTFKGNDRVSISSIDVSGGIAKSRDTGYLPAFVMVSASNIIATGTSRPYEDLEYRWDFGDPGGTEVFLNPVTDRNENMNTQLGPEAAYCYRTAGSYTIRLTIRGKTAGGYVTQTAQTTFMASNLSDEGTWTHYYFDSNAAVDGDGLSEGSPWNDPQKLLWSSTPSLRGKTSGYRSAVHIKRGSIINCSGEQQMYCYAGWLRMDAYGTGDKPLITGTGLANHSFGSYPGIFTMNCQDSQSSFGISGSPGEVVISNIAFQRLDANKCIVLQALNRYPAQLHDIYFDNCEFDAAIYMLSSPDVSLENISIIRTGYWGGKIIRNPNTLDDNFPGAPGNWFFMVGLHWENTEASTGGDSIITHSVYVTVTLHSLWKNILLQPCGLQNQFKHSINSSIANGQWHLISNCWFEGSDGISPGRSNEVNNFKDFVDYIIEGCMFLNTRSTALDMEDPRYYTIRDNYFAKSTSYSGAVRTRAACFETTSLNIYRNKMYGPAGGVHFNNWGWDFANQVTGNVFWNTGAAGTTGARSIEMVQADQATAGTVIDYNQYYHPTTTSVFCNDGGNNGATNLSFASWQAAGWDANGAFLGQAPSWPDPANGDFGQ